MQPKVTVLMTVYNRETVNRTIESILQQTFRNFEFLIIDNASTDNTREVISSYDDERIKLYVNDKNRGQTYSLNRGLSLAKGEYIARIDADDIALPSRLEEQVAFLDNHEDYGLCGTWVRYITDDDVLTITMKMPETDEKLRAMQLFACGMYHPSAMYRKSIIIENKITYDKDIMISEDYELWRKLLSFSKGMNIPKILTYYRKGSNDSVKHEEIMFKEALGIRKKINISEFNENEKQTRKFEKCLCIENKEKKSVFDIIQVKSILQKACLEKYGIDPLKDSTLHFHFFMHLYTVAIHYNKALWARLIEFLYRWCKKMVYKMSKEEI